MHAATDIAPALAWFTAYCRTFYTGDAENDRHIRLKEEHSLRVRANAAEIARQLGLPVRDAFLAELAGLLHDTGRFPQYRQYRTFRDSDSTNHGVLGARVLASVPAVDGLPAEDRLLVLRTVAVHNAFSLPAGLSDRSRTFAGLVRDADKLDIWEIFIGYLAAAPGDRSAVAGLGLPDHPACSPEVLGRLREGRLVRLEQLRTLNDFVLLQLSWAFDLHFPPAVRLMQERDIIGRFAAGLPATPEVAAAVDAVRGRLRDRLAEPDPR